MNVTRNYLKNYMMKNNNKERIHSAFLFIEKNYILIEITKYGDLEEWYGTFKNSKIEKPKGICEYEWERKRISVDMQRFIKSVYDKNK